jgi:diguanylate cyclase (GGDEF)-like protein/PAS domain S-box-containing protein
MTRTGSNPGPMRVAWVSSATLLIGLSLAVATALMWRMEPGEHSIVIALGLGSLLSYVYVRPQREIAAENNVESIPLDEVAFVPMLVLLPPSHAFVIVGVASLAGSIAVHRHWVKTVFNLGATLFATALAVSTLYLLGVRPSFNPSVTAVIAAMAATLVYNAGSAALVRAMVSYATGTRFSELSAELARRIRPWVGAVTLGGVGTLVITQNPLAAILVGILILFVQGSYASSLRELSGRRRAEQLQQAIASLRGQHSADAVLDDLVHATEKLLAAKTVSTAARGAPVPAAAIDAPLGDDLKLVVDRRRGGGDWSDEDRSTLLTLAGVAGDVLHSTELVTQLRTITNSQSEGVIAVDLKGRVTFANPAALSMTGYADEAATVGHPIGDVCRLRHVPRDIDLTGMLQRGEVAQDVDAVLVGSFGKHLDVAYSFTPLQHGDAQPGAVLVLRDVTERRALQDAITHRALHDELTGLPNRRLLFDRLDHAMARLNRDGGQHGVLFMDLDRFKLVNDSYGHLAGDRLLVEVSTRIRESLGSADTLARFSGDEFVVLLEDVGSVEEAVTVANQLLKALDPPFAVEDHAVYISGSIGVALAHPGQSRDDVLAAADTAAYSAKDAGRSCVQVSASTGSGQARNRLDVEAQLRTAVDNNELTLHYQPITTTGDAAIVGVEALVRWPTSDRGLVYPEQFIPLAEETGLIGLLGRWVLDASCRTVHAWTVRHPERPPLTLSVNVSPRQFIASGFADEVATVLDITGLQPTQLCLEITESVLMADSRFTREMIQAIRDLGVRIAIDDFGVGYSSLSYLKRFPIDVVKLDRSFTSGLGHDVVDAEIVATVLRLADALGIQTIAEGVETSTQRRRLHELGCTLMQGFLIARPLPVADFEQFWEQQSS